MRLRAIAIYCFIAGLVAVVASFSQTFNSSNRLSSASITVEAQMKPGKLGQSGDVGSSASHATSFLALPAPFIIQSHLLSSFLFEIFNGAAARRNENSPYFRGSIFCLNVCTRIIFTLIICPNAP